MARSEITGQRKLHARNVSHSNIKTMRWQHVNVQRRRLWVPELGKHVTLKLTTTALHGDRPDWRCDVELGHVHALVEDAVRQSDETSVRVDGNDSVALTQLGLWRLRLTRPGGFEPAPRAIRALGGGFVELNGRAEVRGRDHPALTGGGDAQHGLHEARLGQRNRSNAGDTRQQRRACA
jgi:large subunit ribosomal protein L28